jgi:prevent-host-death family protein
MDRLITTGEITDDILREVAAGESFVVTADGRPIARVVPVDDLAEQARDIDALLDELEASPERLAAPWTRTELYE